MPQVSTVRIDGRALRGLRTRRGLTVTQLAAKTGRHPQSVRRLETGGEKIASEVFAYQLANALQAELAEITLNDSTPDDPEQDASETAEKAA